MTTRKHVGRAGAELLLVILGVLVALSADRWVQALDQKERQRTQLEWILRDLQTDSAMLETAIAEEERRRVSATRLLGAADASQEALMDLRPDTLVYDLVAIGWSTPPTFSTGTWDELKAAGELSLIEDSELRRALSGYYQSQLRLRESEEDREFFFRDLERRTIRVRPLYVPADAPTDGSYSSLGAEPAEVAQIAEAVREDPELRGLVTYAGTAGFTRVRIFREYLTTIRSLMASVRAAIP